MIGATPTLRRLVGTVVTLLAIAVAGVGLAWACSPDAVITPSADEGPTGRQIQIEGRGFVPGATVEIRWNALSGPELARAEGPEFSVPVTIPAGRPDEARIYAVAYGASNQVVGTASAVYWVGGRPAAQGTTERSTSLETTEGSLQTPGAAPDGALTDARETTAQAERRPAAQRNTVTARGQAPDRGAQRPAAKPVARAVVPAATAEPSLRSAAAPAIAAPREPERAAPAPRARDARPEPVRPSAQSATGDLWSGFARSDSPKLSTSVGAGVAGGSSTQMTFGLALLGLGLVALLGGALVVQTRRRRAAAQGRHTDL